MIIEGLVSPSKYLHPEVGHLGLREQLAQDLRKYLAQYSNPTIGLRLMSQEMGIHKRTLARLMEGENKAGYLTLYKIYRVLLHTKNDTELFDKAPECIQAALKAGNPKPLAKEIIYSVDIEQEICRDRCFGEIYLLAGCGTISEDLILFRFGQYGVETAKRMLKLGVLREAKSGHFTLGNNQANLSAETLKYLGIDLIQRFADPERTDELGENFMGLFVEGLSEEGYQEWLKIEEEAYQRKVELANNSNFKGHIKAFTFQVTDKLTVAKGKRK